MMDKSKLWSGRFDGETSNLTEAFTASQHFDRRLAEYDLAGTMAHVRMLQACSVITPSDSEEILTGLRQIIEEIREDRFPWRVEHEDVHMNIEVRLIELIGDAGKKVHTGRSRNDQVATDLRLFVRAAIDQILQAISALQSALVDVAEREADTIMPGLTHLQSAQPVTAGHHLLAWVEMVERDWQRFGDCRRRVNVSPLGSGALAGTSFPIDREMTAAELGFEDISATLLGIHLSRMAEDLVLWSSENCRFVDLGDAFCTGSSIMPQKKNPDVAELVRGKSGRLLGNVTSLMVLMKGQPLSYNRDNQEDKEPLFDTVDTVLACLQVMTAMLSNMRFDREVMRAAAVRGYATATDLADYLVRKGIPFRDAHAVVGKVIRSAQDQGVDLDQLSLDVLREFSPHIQDDIYDVLSLEGSIAARDQVGGTAPQQVRKAIDRGRQRLAGR
jgi:argininosuccinate lyase